MATRRKWKRSLPKFRSVYYTCTQLGCWYTFVVCIKASEGGYLPCPRCGYSAEKLSEDGLTPEQRALKDALLGEV